MMGAGLWVPSMAGRCLSLSDVRKRERSLKLQLFCTFSGLAASGGCSELGEGRASLVGRGDALARAVWAARVLFIRIRSRKPIFPPLEKMAEIKTLRQYVNSKGCWETRGHSE